MTIRSVRDADLKGRRVLTRVDLNVPLRDGAVADDTRIRAILPNLELMLQAGARVILVAHLGRPKGKPDARYSLQPVAEYLDAKIPQAVRFVPSSIGPEAAAAVAALKDGEVLLLENLRFHPGEEANDAGLARQLADLADVYVSDAFGTLHRAHASVAAVTEYLPSYAGLLVERELEAFRRMEGDALARPFVALMGGAKVSDKVPLIENLKDRVDRFLVGGAMAFCFLKAKGLSVGGSKVEEDAVEEAGRLLGVLGDRIELPTDVVVAAEFSAEASPSVVPVTAIPADQMGLDIGPDTAARFAGFLEQAGTVLWNGPMGVFEMAPFAEGTRRVGEALARSKAFTIVGGGDSAAAVAQFELEDRMGHVSTGGGASLEYMSGIKLPGLAALEASAARATP